jgi:hypothetical protein
MSKKNRKPQTPKPEGPAPASQKGIWIIGVTNLVAVVAILTISFANWQAVIQVQGDMTSRLARIETRIDQVTRNVQNVTKEVEAAVANVNKKPARRGPDPNRVYKIKTAGAPAIGPGNAPVTIVEFSDFQ